MKELKCPKCGNVFQVDEVDYASIVSQVKTPSSTKRSTIVCRILTDVTKWNRIWQLPKPNKLSKKKPLPSVS